MDDPDVVVVTSGADTTVVETPSSGDDGSTVPASVEGDLVRAETAAVVAEAAAEGAIVLATTQAALVEMDAASRIAGYEEWQNSHNAMMTELSSQVAGLQGMIAGMQETLSTLQLSQQAPPAPGMTVDPGAVEGPQDQPTSQERARYRRI